MTKTHGERISSLESGFEYLVKPMSEDIQSIKTSVQDIALKMPELLRRVGEHHDFMKISKIAGCPRPKNNPGSDSNRERNERKMDQRKYKYMIWGYLIMGTAGIISTILLIIFK